MPGPAARVILRKLLGSVFGQSPAAREARAARFVEQGVAALGRGDVRVARRVFAAAADLQPASPGIHRRIALACLAAGHHDAAQEHLERCVVLERLDPEPLGLLGNLHRLKGEAARAEERYRQALALDAGSRLAHCNLALLLAGQGRRGEALGHFRAAHARSPLRGETLRPFVEGLIESGAGDEAGDIAEQAVAADPASFENWYCLGLARYSQHRHAEALAACEGAAALKAGDADLLMRRAMTLHELGRLEDALADYDAVLRLKPGDPLARFHRSLTLLLLEDYAAAWPDYDTRLLSEDIPQRPRRYPRWDGTAARGLTILAYGEQGLGDEIMFASCVPDLLRSGARCVLDCNVALQPLFAHSFPEATVYATPADRRVPDAVDALGIDCEIPLGSLPRQYRQRAADFPRHEGYLRAPPERVAAWRERLAALGPGPKIGLSWRGGIHKSRAPLRSIDLPRLLPVLRLPGLRFVNLQYTAGAAQELEELARVHGVEVVHWPEAIADYSETAALVSALDLTVSVCTSIVHLAGALGRPVWVMAPHTPEWRYGHRGEALRWYPSARMFRQRDDKQWQPVIEAVAARLARGIEG